MTPRRRVVVTGMGAITPLGHDVLSTWKNLIDGRSGAGPITLFDASEHKSRIAAEVRDFDPLDHFDKKDVRRYDRFSQLAMVAAREAMHDAGVTLDPDSEEATMAGCILGVGFGGMQTFIEEIDTLRDRGPDRASPFGIPKIIANIASGLVSIEHNLLGPVSTAVTACAASANAIGDAAELIKRGAADMILAGGAEAAVTEYAVAAFASAKALTTRNEDPVRASRPFDADRDGFLIGEGAAALVLEERQRAIDRGANVLAEVTGYGMSADAYHVTLPRPGGAGAARSMDAALRHAELEPAQIGYINAHGTSTGANDSTETAAIKLSFGQTAATIPISSTKSMTGHLLGAAGAVEAIAAIRSITDGVIPPTINYENPDPECDLDYVPNEAREATVDHAMSNSFGFGGHNVALIVSRP